MGNEVGGRPRLWFGLDWWWGGGLGRRPGARVSVVGHHAVGLRWKLAVLEEECAQQRKSPSRSRGVDENDDPREGLRIWRMDHEQIAIGPGSRHGDRPIDVVAT